MKILILKYRNIGDVLLVSPLIENLKIAYPNSKIDFCVNKDTEDMISSNRNVNKIFTYDRSNIKKYSLIKRIYHEVKFFLSFRSINYDLLINLTEGDRGALVSFFSKSQKKIGVHSKNAFLRRVYDVEIPQQEYRHTIDANLDPLRCLGIPILEKKVRIYWEKKDDLVIDKITSRTQEFIHIHPVSRWMFKCISDKTMSSIIDFCELELGTKVLITSSSDLIEKSKVEKIISNCKSNPINLSGRLSLKQTAALNKRAKMFIGIDTAIMHVSAANNIPVLAFFGPSGANHWGPWDNSFSETSYLKRQGFQKMGMHRVISEERACQPCGKDGCNGSKISDCLMNIDLETIKKNIKEMLSE